MKRLLVTFHLDGGCNTVDIKVIERDGKYVVLDGSGGELPDSNSFRFALNTAAECAGWSR